MDDHRSETIIRSLKARYVFPVTADPIDGGVVAVDRQRIVAVGCSDIAGEVEDLGNVAIIPGLVNAHTHLEFSELPEPLGTPGIGMVDWIRLVIERFRRTADNFDRPIERGLRESIQSGVTALGQIAQPGWPVELFKKASLDTTVFLELIASASKRVAPAIELASQHVRSGDASACWRPGLSPHAPYSVLPRVLEAAVSLSAQFGVPLAFHLAESREELQLLRSESGPFRDLLDELGTCDPELFTPGRRPLDYLQALHGAHRVLIVHGNYLDDEEIAFLAERAERMSVVYCPRTHEYFRHDRYPLEKLLAAGATVALGTDSRASSPDLSLLAEMRLVAEKYPAVGRDTVLRMATLGGAAALGRDHEIGSLQPGKLANLAVVALPDGTAADPHELLFNSDRPVVETWYRDTRITAGCTDDSPE